MEISENLGELTKALAKARSSFPAIPKNRIAKGKTFSYRYADLTDVLVAVTPELSKNGLTLDQWLGHRTEKGLEITTMLSHSSGEFKRSTFTMPLPGSDPQSVGKGITYGRRYAACAALGINAEEDDDCLPDTKKAPPKYGETYEGSPDDKRRLAGDLSKVGIKDKDVMSAFSEGFIGKKWDSFKAELELFVSTT